MLDHETRAAIHALYRRGRSRRAISRDLDISRNTVNAVLDSGSSEVPLSERPEILAPHRDRVLDLWSRCEGNLMLVHEALCLDTIEVSYPALTAFCRRHGIGVAPKKPAGRLEFGPGVEMQHDTSPHAREVGGKRRTFQCASLVLAHSRMLFAQVYPTFNRFYCRAFLTEAMVFFGGAAGRCMTDNTSVVIAHGSGDTAVFAPEMEAFAKRFGFAWKAHAPGHADRSAFVERPFGYIEGNFYPNRTFHDLADVNRQMRDWCVKVNGLFRPKLHSKPIDLFAAERPFLRPLPPYIPEVYRIHDRVVDVYGYVTVDGNAYSVPSALITERVEVRETLTRITIARRHNVIAQHERAEPGARARHTLPEHRLDRPPRGTATRPCRAPEAASLRAAHPALDALVGILERRHGGRANGPIRRLHGLYVDLPTEPLIAAIERALQHGLYDVGRIEGLALERVRGDFFQLPTPRDDE